MKRLTWFAGGVVAGAVGSGAAKRRVRAVTAELSPAHLAKRAGTGARRSATRVADAVREGRAAARMRELELRGLLDARTTTLAEELDDPTVESILVDGTEVEPGKVIVLRQLPEGAPRRVRRQRRRA